MKNWMGVMGGSRGKLSQNLDEGLVDVSIKLRPCLIVLDAVRILTANGPQGGELRDVKRLDTVIAGIDQVAVDSVRSDPVRPEGESAWLHRSGTQGWPRKYGSRKGEDPKNQSLIRCLTGIL